MDNEDPPQLPLSLKMKDNLLTIVECSLDGLKDLGWFNEEQRSFLSCYVQQSQGFRISAVEKNNENFDTRDFNNCIGAGLDLLTGQVEDDKFTTKDKAGEVDQYFEFLSQANTQSESEKISNRNSIFVPSLQIYGQDFKPIIDSEPESITDTSIQEGVLIQNENKTDGWGKKIYGSSPFNFDGQIVGSNEPPLGTNNKGAQMMAKMGWKLGDGLGANKQGIRNPVKATIKTTQAGLGSDKQDFSHTFDLTWPCSENTAIQDPNTKPEWDKAPDINEAMKRALQRTRNFRVTVPTLIKSKPTNPNGIRVRYVHEGISEEIPFKLTSRIAAGDYSRTVHYPGLVVTVIDPQGERPGPTMSFLKLATGDGLMIMRRYSGRLYEAVAMDMRITGLVKILHMQIEGLIQIGCENEASTSSALRHDKIHDRTEAGEATTCYDGLDETGTHTTRSTVAKFNILEKGDEGGCLIGDIERLHLGSRKNHEQEDAGRNEFDAAYEMYRAAYGDSYP